MTANPLRKASSPLGADQQDPYTIGELSSEFDVTLRTLRFCESEALLVPGRNGQTRIYSARDRARLALILPGKQLGFALDEIHAMFANSGGRQMVRSA
jgi:DNA-binding transcriptional MerR regulator